MPQGRAPRVILIGQHQGPELCYFRSARSGYICPLRMREIIMPANTPAIVKDSLSEKPLVSAREFALTINRLPMWIVNNGAAAHLRRQTPLQYHLSVLPISDQARPLSLVH